jgi:hypothetical protein
VLQRPSLNEPDKAPRKPVRGAFLYLNDRAFSASTNKLGGSNEASLAR